MGQYAIWLEPRLKVNDRPFDGSGLFKRRCFARLHLYKISTAILNCTGNRDKGITTHGPNYRVSWLFLLNEGKPFRITTPRMI